MNPFRRRAAGHGGVLLLLYQIFGMLGTSGIPPVTLSLVGLQVAIFLRLIKFPWHKLSGVCISFYNVYHKREYSRLLFSALEHADDWHLYYNMISFIVKGQSLERRFGSLKFLYITSVFTILTNIMYVILTMLASAVDRSFETQCAVGFSGVLFALKVLTSYFEPHNSHHIMGIPVLLPSRYVVWAELILIQILVPNVSFVGHLSGALVGLAYVMGPLRFVMDSVYSLIAVLFNSEAPIARGQPPRFVPRAEATGYHAGSQFSEYVPPGMSEEEQLQQATAASLHNNFSPYGYDALPPYPTSGLEPNAPPPPYPTSGLEPLNVANAPPPPGLYPDLDKMRRRRLEHFQL